MSKLCATMATSRRGGARTAPQGARIARAGAGLAALDNVSCLLVKQHVEMFEAMTGWETANQYTVLDEQGNPIYNVQEESGGCMRQCCKSNRSFVLHVLDTNNEPVLRFERPYRFYWHEMLIRDAVTGNIIGTVSKGFAFFSRLFHIRNAVGQHLFDLTSPMFSPWTFYITEHDTQAQLGTVKKKWSGLAQEIFTDADNFGVEFPARLPRESKSLLLASCLLVDYMYFEDNNVTQRNRRGRRGGLGLSPSMF